MITPHSPLPVALPPLTPDGATGGASFVPPSTEGAPPQNRIRSLSFASGHTVFGDAKSINFVSDMLDQNEREIRLLRRQLAEALDDTAEIKAGITQCEKVTA